MATMQRPRNQKNLLWFFQNKINRLAYFQDMDTLFPNFASFAAYEFFDPTGFLTVKKLR